MRSARCLLTALSFLPVLLVPTSKAADFPASPSPSASPGPPVIQVRALESGLNLGALQGGSVKIHAPDNREVPAPGIVNGWIARAGLRPHTGGMDQLERDLLVIRARHGTLERLVERYPELPRASLEKLRRLAGGDSGGDIGSGR